MSEFRSRPASSTYPEHLHPDQELCLTQPEIESIYAYWGDERGFEITSDGVPVVSSNGASSGTPTSFWLSIDGKHLSNPYDERSGNAKRYRPLYMDDVKKAVSLSQSRANPTRHTAIPGPSASSKQSRRPNVQTESDRDKIWQSCIDDTRNPEVASFAMQRTDEKELFCDAYYSDTHKFPTRAGFNERGEWFYAVEVGSADYLPTDPIELSRRALPDGATMLRFVNDDGIQEAMLACEYQYRHAFPDRTGKHPSEYIWEEENEPLARAYGTSLDHRAAEECRASMKRKARLDARWKAEEQAAKNNFAETKNEFDRKQKERLWERMNRGSLNH